LNGNSSEWASVLSGVPQGSVLGPILFLIFINDLGDDVKDMLSIFADDTKLFAGVGSESEVQSLQESIDQLNRWTQDWLMEFNESKCVVMHLGSNNPHNKYTLGSTVLSTTRAERDVGVIIQDNGKPGEQCKSAASTCNKIIGQISRSFTNREPTLMLEIFNCYVCPHLEYAVIVWNPWHQKDIDILESVQRRFTRLIAGMQGLSYEERITTLGISSLKDRRTELDLIQAYRLIYKIDQIDHEPFKKVSQVHDKSTRSSTKADLRVNATRLDLRKNFFTNRVVTEWNKLPHDLQTAPSLAIFKSKLRKLI
jgi:hypothetical protein